MNKIKIIIFLILALNMASLNAREKERGIDRLNFYIPVKERNKFTSFGEIENRSNKDIYQWTIGEGYMDVNERWDFNYKFEREFHKEKEGMKRKYKVWDNEISLARLNNGFKIGEKIWNHRTLIGLKHSENDINPFHKDYAYKYYIGQKLSTFFNNAGMGGTYLEIEGLANGVSASGKNGYSMQAALKSSSALGYGFQWRNVLESEYMNYSQYEGAVRGKIESVFRWTYEVGTDLAFSPEATVKGEKYFSVKDNNYTFESTLGMYLLYSHNITEKLRISGKGGPVYRKEKARFGEMKNSKSGFSGYGRIGFEYIF